VKRFVRKLTARPAPQAHPVIHTRPGEEGQVDYGEGPMVRHPESGKYVRTRLFVFTLAHSRKSVRPEPIHRPQAAGAERRVQRRQKPDAHGRRRDGHHFGTR
jgi:hypothetical protein